MKPPPFTYYAPETVDEAISLLTELGDDGKVLAGGQSLVPLMNMRLARPAALVDLRRIDALASYSSADGVAIGAMVRQSALRRDAALAGAVPLLTEALSHVGHPAIQERGTLVGSIAHADPAAEAPIVALALDAEMVARGPAGSRTVAAEDFFLGPFTTALAPDEIVTEVRLRPLNGSRCAFEEVARRHGDFAIVAVAAVARVHDGCFEDVRIVVGGVAGTPVRMREAESSLNGQPVADEGVRADAARLVAEALDPTTDIHGSAAYRRQVAGVLTSRALARCVRESTTTEGSPRA